MNSRPSWLMRSSSWIRRAPTVPQEAWATSRRRSRRPWISWSGSRSCARIRPHGASSPECSTTWAYGSGSTSVQASRTIGRHGCFRGGIMAFGNRLLPCPLRTSGGRPIVGGQPPQEHGHAHDQHPDGGCDGRHKENFGKAQSPAGSRTAPSRRRGKSIETNDPSRGDGVGTSVDPKNPRQPTRTGRLSKGNSSGRT